MRARSASAAAVIVLLLAVSIAAADSSPRAGGLSIRAGAVVPLGDMAEIYDVSPLAGVHMRLKYLQAGLSYMTLQESGVSDPLSGFMFDAGLRVPISEWAGLSAGAAMWLYDDTAAWDTHLGFDAVFTGGARWAPDLDVRYGFAFPEWSAQYLTLSAGVRFLSW